jgi:hypothetical protein
MAGSDGFELRLGNLCVQQRKGCQLFPDRVIASLE